jgi:hypothetical protein
LRGCDFGLRVGALVWAAPTRSNPGVTVTHSLTGLQGLCVCSGGAPTAASPLHTALSRCCRRAHAPAGPVNACGGTGTSASPPSTCRWLPRKLLPPSCCCVTATVTLLEAGDGLPDSLPHGLRLALHSLVVAGIGQAVQVPEADAGQAVLRCNGILEQERPRVVKVDLQR